MNSDSCESHVNSKAAISAASLISAAGSAVFLILPLMLGGAADALNLDDEQTGLVASSYFAGFLVVCLTAVFWIRRVNWQLVSGVGFLFLSGGLFAGAFVDQFFPLVTWMVVAGIGAGTIFGLAICVISDTADPDRNFGFKLVAEQAVGAALLFLLPLYVSSHYGFQGLMFAVAASMALLGLVTPWLPERGHRATAENADTTTKGSTLPVWIALVALMIYFSGLSGLWAFVERLATDRGIDPVSIGQALSIGVIGGGFGALGAALLGDRFGRALPLILSTALLAGVLLIYSGTLTPLLFTLGTVIFSAVWNYGLAYQMGIVVSLDHQGKLSVLISSFLSVGAIVGPAVAGGLIKGDSYAGVMGFMAVTMVLGLLAFLLLLIWFKRPPVAATAQA